MKKKVKDSEFAKMEKVHKPINKYVDKGMYFYCSYGIRITLMFLSVLVLGVIAYKCFSDSFSDQEEIVLNYDEKADIDYDVLLFENNPFESGTLNPVDSYISDLIDNISTDFRYSYNFDNEVDVKYSYYIIASMELKNADGNPVSKNDYQLMPKVEKELENTKEVNIVQNINLDYDSYNNLAKSIKNQYGLDLQGEMHVKMYINMETNYNNFNKQLINEKELDVVIPLLSTQVKAELVNAIDKQDKFVEYKNPKLVVPMTLYMGITLLIIDTVFCLLAISFIFKATPKKSKYCILRNGLLRDYDRIIVNCKKLPNLDGYNIIDCYSFSELLDAQRLLEKPILYYEIVKDQKCIFVILGNNDAYKFTLKECDLEF